MATTSAFFPAVKGGAAGQTVLIQATLSPGTVAVFPGTTTSILAQVQGVIGAPAYIRISAESSTTIQATTAVATGGDTPVMGSGSAAVPTVKLFATPGPAGQVTVAIAVTTTSSVTNIWLTPGTGGTGAP